MSKDINYRIEVGYGDVYVERIISSKTTVRIDKDTLELNEEQVNSLFKALSAYMGAEKSAQTNN